MDNESKSPVPAEYFLEPGFIFVASSPTVISTVLGSCVSVCIYDRERSLGGINHFQFPYMKDPEKATARYGNVATLTLIRLMLKEGSKAKHLEAQIFGGAHNPAILTHNVGLENVMAAKKMLGKHRISLVSEDVGGQKGRKIVFNSGTNEVAVLKVGKLRKGDWYPYGSER